MGWDSSTRRDDLPADWSARRMRVLRRDGYRCQARDSTGRQCGDPANQADHIVPGPNHDEDNLQALCRWHHARKSSAEGVAARKPRPTREAPREAHPGAV